MTRPRIWGHTPPNPSEPVWYALHWSPLHPMAEQVAPQLKSPMDKTWGKKNWDDDCLFALCFAGFLTYKLAQDLSINCTHLFSLAGFGFKIMSCILANVKGTHVMNHWPNFILSQLVPANLEHETATQVAAHCSWSTNARTALKASKAKRDLPNMLYSEGLLKHASQCGGMLQVDLLWCDSPVVLHFMA